MSLDKKVDIEGLMNILISTKGTFLNHLIVLMVLQICICHLLEYVEKKRINNRSLDEPKKL